MFDKKFATRGVSETIDLDIQLCLWGLINEWKKQGIELDYLQVFELYVLNVDGKLMQKVVHFQEQPSMKQELHVIVVHPTNKKLWIVANDNENAVLMFPEEY